ncbi:hypothetical protein MN116_004870 [Schistosoma mekongi]|uniref:Protein ABHD18 n=1 Tax=Schistosoma mekongi TaxID=38744 RepID=A0AAE1ZDR9_SCHME|nr:hypothetical protein MN116_004870 [Schistosoma mekongi]
MSTFDKIYRIMLPLKFFSKGWGAPDTLLKLIENMKTVTNRDMFCSMKTRTNISIEKKSETMKTIEIEGSFLSPFDSVIPNALTGNNKIARFQMIIPKIWSTNYRPICVHFAGTGDHNYFRRRFLLANRLVDDGVASLIIMNPFYATRKPKEQRGSGLNFVSDLLIMGGALIMECSALLEWCENKGYGPFALHGISMGGYMSALCATVWPKPISLIPCLSWTSASVVFVEGILSRTVDWSALTKQYYSDSVYSGVIRPQLQPCFPDLYKTDAGSNDYLGNYIKNPFKLSNTLYPKQSNSMNVDPLLALSEQTDARLDVVSNIKVHSSNSSDSILQVCEELSPHSINVSDSASQSSSHSNIRETHITRSFLPYNVHISFPNSLSSINFNTILRYPLNNPLWHNSVSFVRSLPDINRMMSTNSTPDPEVRQFLRDLLDHFTHLGNFSPVIDSRLVLSVAAEYDAYVPRDGVCSLSKIYPHGEIRFLSESGHVGAYVRNAFWTDDFRRAINDCLNRQVQLYHHKPGPFGQNESRSMNVKSIRRSKG